MPPELAKWAGLAGEVMIVGVRDHIEIWAVEKWEQYVARCDPQYDQLGRSWRSWRRWRRSPANRRSRGVAKRVDDVADAATLIRRIERSIRAEDHRTSSHRRPSGDAGPGHRLASPSRVADSPLDAGTATRAEVGRRGGSSFAAAAATRPRPEVQGCTLGRGAAFAGRSRDCKWPISGWHGG